MNIGEVLIWESSNLLLLIPAVIWLVMLVRRLQGKAVFTERDWLLLFGIQRVYWKTLDKFAWLIGTCGFIAFHSRFRR